MGEFDGVRVFITGAASGFGLACAEALLGQAAKVVLADIDEAQLNRAAERLNARARGQVLAVKLDVTSPASVKDAFAKCQSAFDGLDALVNSAGIIKVSPLAEVSEQEWDRTLDVNLKGAFLCSQAAAPM